jgi:hypothetical protein
MTTIFSSAFLVLLFLLHFLEPEFDPSWRMISEYALGRYGWVMMLAFICWAGSILSLTLSQWQSLATRSGKIARVWLLVIVVALVCAAIFKTNVITDPTPNFAHRVHALSGAIVIITFPIAASLVARNRPGLLGITILVWLSLFAFFGSILVSRIVHPGAGRVGPDVLMGWPNRFLAVTYHLWLILAARRSAMSASVFSSSRLPTR